MNKKLKILCLADIHNSRQAIQAINNHLANNYCSSKARTKKLYNSQSTTSASNNKYDLVLCAGDIVSRPNKNAASTLKEFINVVTKLHKTRLLMVHGNNETEKIIDLMRKEKVLAHLVLKKVKGHKIYGIGGWMEDLPEISNLKSKISNSILLTHLSPKRSSQPITTNHNQSQQITDGPLVHLCGHLHGPGSIWRIGETLVVKIPSAMYLKAAVLEMPGRKIKFIDL